MLFFKLEEKVSKERKKLIKELDKVFGDFIKERDKFRCCICNKTEPEVKIDPGHLISRVNMATRFDEMNCFAQCRGHNFSHEHHPEIMIQWFIHNFGIQDYDLLIYKSHHPAKFSEADLKLMIRLYKSKLNKLRGEV